MADYEFTSNGVLYPDITLEDVRTFIEADHQGIISNPWDELRVHIGKHAVTPVEVRVLHGRIDEPNGHLIQRYIVVRPDTDEVVDEFDVPFPLPQTPEQGRELIRRGL